MFAIFIYLRSLSFKWFHFINNSFLELICKQSPIRIKDVSSMSSKEATQFFNSFDTVISDCDGVLWKAEPIIGVAETLAKLNEMGKNLFFLSNNSTKSFQQYAQQFHQIGITMRQDSLIHPAITIGEYLKEINFKKKIFCIGTSMFVDMLVAAGGNCVTADGVVPEDLKWFLENSKDDEEIGAVVMDYDINCNYLKISKALVILQRPDVLFLVGSTDSVIPVANRLSFLGPGPFIKIVTELSGRQPLYMGKPSTYLEKIITKRFKINNPKRTLIIGDTINNDMAFGDMCGFQKLLVLSSGVPHGEALEGDHRPDYVIETLGHMKTVLDKI